VGSADAACDQAAVLQFADPEGDVDAGRNEVDETVVEQQVDLDLGIARIKAVQPRHDVAAPEGGRRRHAQHARNVVFGALYLDAGIFERIEHLAAACVIQLAGLGQRMAARRAHQQGGAELGFQRLHLLADRRLGRHFLARHRRKAAPLDDTAKGFHQTQPVHIRLFIPVRNKSYHPYALPYVYTNGHNTFMHGAATRASNASPSYGVIRTERTPPRILEKRPRGAFFMHGKCAGRACDPCSNSRPTTIQRGTA